MLKTQRHSSERCLLLKILLEHSEVSIPKEEFTAVGILIEFYF